MHPRLAVVGVLTMMATFGFGCSLQRHPIVDHAPEHSWTVVAVFAANSFSNPAVEVVVAPTCYHNHDVVNVQVFDESRNELLAQYRFGETNHIREPPPSALPMRKQTISYARFAIEPVIIRVEVRDASGVLLGCWHENLRVALQKTGQVLLAEYRYNGLGHRLSWKYDTDEDSDVDRSDRTYFFVYDLKWRPVATYRGTDTNPKERFIFHNAGLAGGGSSSYIDSVIMRDKDANTAWDAASDATLEERRYYVQNWRADVVALLKGDGAVSEWIRYSAYGEATVYPFVNGDYDGSGGVDGDDVIAFLADQDNNIAAADVDRSGAVDGDDVTAFYASWDNGYNGGIHSFSRTPSEQAN